MKIDLGWGNSVAVREAFINTYHGNPMVVAREELMGFDYPTHEGDPELVEITRDVILRQTGQSYKHVFMVNGATGGVVIALRAYVQKGYRNCITRPAPYYVRYPRMIQASGIRHADPFYQDPKESVILLDLPSNPLGLMTEINRPVMPTIIDGVYLNKVYAPAIYQMPVHDVMIGSYSKLLGINGIRVGWLATNDDLLAERMKELVASEYCGLSQASTDILKHTLQGFEWDLFEALARFKLDCNRMDFSKLEKFFDGTPVPSVGMFYYGPMDRKAQEIFQKANVNWTPGSALGTDDGFARFNIGASNEQINKAVKAILKADRI